MHTNTYLGQRQRKKGMHIKVHTLFVSNPCMATAIILVSQNLFYEQLPEGCPLLL